MAREKFSLFSQKNSFLGLMMLVAALLGLFVVTGLVRKSQNISSKAATPNSYTSVSPR